jgi:hypothetical protein
MLTLREESCRMFPDAHACDEVRVPDARNVPAVTALQMEMSVMVSEVPPFVHCGVPPMEMEPLEAVPKVTDCRVFEPAETAVVPAAPGAAVWICTYTLPDVV